MSLIPWFVVSVFRFLLFFRWFGFSNVYVRRCVVLFVLSLFLHFVLLFLRWRVSSFVFSFIVSVRSCIVVLICRSLFLPFVVRSVAHSFFICWLCSSVLGFVIASASHCLSMSCVRSFVRPFFRYFLSFCLRFCCSVCVSVCRLLVPSL